MQQASFFPVMSELFQQPLFFREYRLLLDFCTQGVAFPGIVAVLKQPFGKTDDVQVVFSVAAQYLSLQTGLTISTKRCFIFP